MKKILCSSLLLSAFLTGMATATPAPGAANESMGHPHGGQSYQSNTVKVKGTVKDAHGEPLIGVQVAQKGSTKGTITNIDGAFELSVPQGSTLEFRYVGFKPQSVVVTSSTPLVVVLQEEATELNEVVVTALGIKRQSKALSYNVQEIKGDELAGMKDANFVNALNGKVAGVTINQSSAGTGGAARVVMRGAKSISKSNNALYVVDGVPLYSNTSNKQGSGQFDSSGATESAADINPDDIASVSILTGASAAALYGSAAANGAILITTKKGAAGKLKVSYSYTGEWGTPLVLPEFQNRYGSFGSLDSWGGLIPEGGKGYNVRDFFQTAFNHTNAVSVSGGTDRNQTYLSASATNTGGLMPNNVYNRYNLNARNTTYLLNNDLMIDVNVGYVLQNHRNMINQGEYRNPLVPAYLMPRSDNMSKVRTFEIFDPERNIYKQNWDYGRGDYTLQNPYWVAYRNPRDTRRERVMLSLNTTYDIYKWNESEKWFVGARVRSDITHGVIEDRRYATTDATFDMSKNGFFGQARNVDRQNYADLMTTVNKNFQLPEHHLSLNATLGASIQDSRYDETLIQGPLNEKGFPNLFNVFNIDLSAQKTQAMPTGWIEQTQSIFGSAELGWDSYLYLTITGRNDWASQLANSPQASFFYPSVGLSYIVTESLSPDLKAKLNPMLSYFKVRAAYSSVGSPFQRGITQLAYKPNKDSKTYSNVSVYPVGNLYPERTDSYEVGISSRWLGGMLTLDGSYYYTVTRNQTISVGVDRSSGYESMWIQTGKVRNQGVEASLGLNLGNEEGWQYNSNFTIGYNNNKILSLADNFLNPITNERESMDYLDVAGLGTLKYRLTKGGTLGDIYTARDFNRDANGNIIVSSNGSVSLRDLDTPLKLGSVLPKYNFGWRNELAYKGLSLSLMFTARTGGLVVSMTQAALDHMGVSKDTEIARDKGYYLEGNVPVDPQNYFITRGKNKLAQYYTYSADNIRLQEARLSYRLPRKWLANKADLTLSVIGRNLALIYCKAPFDPESVSSTDNYAQGLDYFMMPAQRNIGVSIKATF